MRRFAYGIIIVYTGILNQASAQTLSQPLPENEKDAAMMLEDGTLDSATWALAREFYSNPVNVPRGELRLLIAAFPLSLSAVPTEERDLAGFEPWSKKEINRFFEVYPELVPFKPVLSFESAREFRYARIGCSMVKYGDSAPMFASHFACSPGPAVSAAGEGRFSGASAAWQRRSIRARLPETGTMTLGNFDLNLDDGLFYGHFPVSAIDSQKNRDWRFAQAAAWNGVLYERALGAAVRGAAFYHGSGGETIYGARTIAKLADHVSIAAGASHAAIASPEGAPPRSHSYIHAGATVTLRSWRGWISAGMDGAHPRAIPVAVHVKHGTGTAGFEASLIRAPEAAMTELSAVRHTCSEKINGSDSLPGDLTVISIHGRLPLQATLHSACGISYYSTVGEAASESYAAIGGSGPVNFEARYSLRRSTKRAADNHGLTASAACGITRRVQGRFYCHCGMQGGVFESLLSRVAARLFISSSAEFTPSVGWYRAAGGRRQATVGLTQTLHLCNSASSQLFVDIPVYSTYTDQCTINAKANFYF